MERNRNRTPDRLEWGTNGRYTGSGKKRKRRSEGEVFMRLGFLLTAERGTI